MVEPIARRDDLTIRRMRDDHHDLALLVGWRNQPHVAEWWSTDDDPAPTTFDRVVERYGPRTDPASPTTSCVIELDGRPVGYIQFCRSATFAAEVRTMGLELHDDAFGIDAFVGEPDLLGRGVGSSAVDLLAMHLFERHDAPQVAITTAVGNLRAHRAFEKAGFRKVAQVFDTDVRGGERVRSWLMTRERPGLG